MALWTGEERRQVEAICGLTTINPFVPERLEAERAVLRDRYRPYQQVWSAQDDLPEESPNVREIAALAETLTGKAAERIEKGAGDSEIDLFRVRHLSPRPVKVTHADSDFDLAVIGVTAII